MKEITMAAFQKKVLLRRAEVQANKLAESIRPEIEAAGFTLEHATLFAQSLWWKPGTHLKSLIRHILDRHGLEVSDPSRRKLDSLDHVRRLVWLEIGSAILKAVIPQVAGPQQLKEQPIGWWSHTFHIEHGEIKAQAVFEEDRYLAYQFRQAVAT